MTPVDIDIPEIALISLKGLIALTIIAGLIDTLFAWLAALAQTNPDGSRKFSAWYAADFLISHGKIWLAIIALGILGTGIVALEVPPIHAAYLAAQIGLGAYVVKVVKSLVDNAKDSSAPPDLP